MRRRPLLRRDLGEKFSEGSRLLWLELERRGLRQSEAEALLGTFGQGRLNRILYGDRKPSLELASKVESIFAVPVAAWQSPPAARFTVPGARPVPARPRRSAA